MKPEDVLAYWFGQLQDGWFSDADERRKLWFGSRESDDSDMREKFGGLISRALNGELESWRETDSGMCAYIILLDQMTRATGRGTSAAFAGDRKALAACKAGMASGADARLPAAHCLFFYMPLEHSEDLADQHLCVSVFDKLQTRFPDRAQAFADSADYARKHLEIIVKFGRFPHRNQILGRAATEEEEQFLHQGGARFGQG